MKILSVFLLALLLAGCGSVGVPTTSYTTRYCVEVHPGSNDVTSASLTDIASNLHATCVRVDYDPPSALNGNNGYDYSWVATAVALGLKLYFITPYVAPVVISSGGFNAAYIAQYVSVVNGLSAFASSIVAVDIVNEPDNDAALAQGQLTAAQYMQLVQAVSPAIHSAAPNAAIVADASANGTPWLLALRPVYPLLSWLAPHPYGIAGTQLWNTAKSLENQTGMQVVIGEWGESPQASSDLVNAVTATAGSVQLVNLYEYENQPGESTKYGLVGTPAFSAYANAILGK